MSDLKDQNMEANDVVVFEDENGNEFQLEVVDYFTHNGQEYVILADACECTCGAETPEECTCEDSEDEVDVYVMKVVPGEADGTEDYQPLNKEEEDEILVIAEKYLNSDLDDNEEE